MQCVFRIEVWGFGGHLEIWSSAEGASGVKLHPSRLPPVLRSLSS